MSKYASEIIKLAESWIGKSEKNGTHKEIIDIYNSQNRLPRGYKVKYTDSWCATTISALAIKLGYTGIIPTECSCQKMIDRFKLIGCWQEDESVTPAKGWICFYDWNDNGKGDAKGWSDHVGIVEKVENGKITVIEGNYSDAVKRRVIDVNGKYIRGYGVPMYDIEPVQEQEYKGNSIVEYLNSIGKPSDFASRKQYAKLYGIKPYIGTSAQNLRLLSLMRDGGKSSPCYPKYTGKSASIDTVFKAIGVPSAYIGTWKKRKAVAVANGISNYTGKASENAKLVSFAKKGILNRV